MEEHKYQTIIEDLLSQFKNIREEIQKMISDLEGISEHIEGIFPEDLQLRYRWVFETKVKTTTELFKTLLDMRKEIGNSLKDEVELRRRIMKDVDSESGLEDLFDVRKLAKKVEEFQKRSKKLKEIEVEKAIESPESDIISDETFKGGL